MIADEEEKSMITSISTENVFNKIEHLVLIKNPQQTSDRGEFLKSTKVYS